VLRPPTTNRQHDALWPVIAPDELGRTVHHYQSEDG
jgi:hypothetical protein